MSSGILIRVDANADIGSGHALRCLAIAEACAEYDLPVTVISAMMPDSIVERWTAEGATVLRSSFEIASSEDAHLTRVTAQERTCSWVIVDGYSFGTEYQQRLQKAPFKILVIDDLGGGEFFADAILNQNLHADADLYGSASRLLLGSTYTLFRSEFRNQVSRAHRIPPRATKILITFGGSDSGNYTESAVESLMRLSERNIDVRIMIGASYAHAATLARRAEGADFPIQIVHNCSRPSDLMRWCDLAISAAGSTSWELAFLGVPFIAISTVENQDAIARTLHQEQIAMVVDSGGNLADAVEELRCDEEQRLRMSQKGSALFDGQGVYRVLQVLDIIDLRLDPATRRDAELLFRWSNDAEVRQASFHSEPIAWDEHLRWLEQKLESADCAIWIARKSDGQPVGVVRLEKDQIGVSVAPAFRGRGYGSRIIALGVRKALAVFRPGVIYALIKTDNRRSCAAFESAGFAYAEALTVGGDKALRYVYSC